MTATWWAGWYFAKLGYSYAFGKKEYWRRRAFGDTPETIAESLQTQYNSRV